MTDTMESKNDIRYDEFDYEPNMIYEITINPDDQHQFCSAKDGRPNKVRSTLRGLLEETGLKYSLRMEISRPRYGDRYKTSIARIHYHGYIVFTSYDNIFTFFCNHWHKLTSWTNMIISSNQDPDRIQRWCTYILKDQRYTPKNVFKLENIRLKDILKWRPSETKASQEDLIVH